MNTYSNWKDGLAAARQEVSYPQDAATREVARLRKVIAVLESLLIANTGEDIEWVRRAVADALKG